MMHRVTGSLITVQRQTGAVYYLKARDRDGRQIKRRLGPVADWPRKAAQDALRDFLTDLGRTPGRGDPGVTFAYAATAYMHHVEHEKDRPRAPSTLRDYRSTISHHLEPRFAGTLIEITVEDVARLRRELLVTGSRRTAQKTLILLHGILKYAMREGWITTNPVAAVERIAVARRTEFAVLNVEEVLALARATPTDQDAALITTAAFTGLRLGELRALRWRDVAWGKRYVHVRRSYTGKGEKTPKSGKARSVPLSDPVARALDALSKRDQHTDPDDRVFCTPTGGVLDDGQIRDTFYAALVDAGIDRDRGTGKSLVFHDLRHTFGTLAVEKFPLPTVQAWMGHSAIATTMVYVHHLDKHGEADALSDLIEGERVPTGTKLNESHVI
jgi:integrase